MIAPRFMGPDGVEFPPRWFRNWVLTVASLAILTLFTGLSLAVYVVVKLL